MAVFFVEIGTFLVYFSVAIFGQDFALDGFFANRYFRKQLEDRIEQSRSSAAAFLLIEI